MKITILLFGSTLLMASTVQGAFSLTFAIGAMYDHNGDDLGINKVGVVIASADSVFPQGNDIVGKSLTQYAQWGNGDDYVVAILRSVSSVVSGDPKSPQSQFSTTTPTADYAQMPGIVPGSKLGIYWFPSIQFTQNYINLGFYDYYGFYASSQVANLGISNVIPNNAFVTPPDLTAGFRIIARNVDALTASQELQMGTNHAPTVADFTASRMIPEPSTYTAIAGLAAFVLCFYRKAGYFKNQIPVSSSTS